MKVLLDTHVMLSLLRRDLPKRYPAIANLLADPATICFVSVASLWEVAIKTRLGKLDPGLPLEEIEGYLEALGLVIISVDAHHVIAKVSPVPATRDPFDRLLLAKCQVENLVLATVDRALADHPLALKA